MNKQDCIETVYDKCMYKNCRNGRYSTGSLSTNPRHKLWIRNSGEFIYYMNVLYDFSMNFPLLM